MVELSFSERAQQPYLCIGLLRTTWSDGSVSLGTCSVVGRNDILTAAHCVYDPDRGGWATGLGLWLGADFNSATGQFESWLSKPSFNRWTIDAWTTQAFTDSDHDSMLQSEAQFDVALIGIDLAVGDAVGWLGLAAGYNGQVGAAAVGYPAGSTGMMKEAVSVSSNLFFGIYESSRDVLGPGSSGGPLLNESNYIIGVKSTHRWWADIGNSFLFGALVEKIAGNDDLLRANSAPVAANGSASTAEDAPLRGQLPAATDADGDTVTYGKGSEPSHGTVTVNANGAYTYTPAPDYHGTDAFSFTVSDGKGGSHTYTQSMKITAVNDAPVLASALPDQKTTVSSAFSYTVSTSAFTDIDNATLAYSATLASDA